jgi:hypothetical protein
MTSASLKILVMYSDRSSARLGERVSESLQRILGERVRCAQSTWNSGLLLSRKLRKLAAEDALHSDVVIIATNDSLELSTELRSWLQLWQDKRAGGAAALIGLDSDPHLNSQGESSIRKSLQQTAARAHMEFFWHSEGLAAAASDPKEENTITYRDADPTKAYEFKFVFRPEQEP